jgi:cullin-associated NEDD8-dissociated protein 1
MAIHLGSPVRPRLRQPSTSKRRHIRPALFRCSRSVGYRFGPHLNEVVPLLISYCKEASENDDELREYSLQALESFVLRCPRDVSEHTDAVLDLALEFLSYDPNYSENMEEDEEEGDEEEEEEEDE